MLVVVHHRDVERLLQAILDIETLWSLDVFEVDSSECWRNLLNGLAEFHRVFLIDLNVEYIDASINFEKQSLTFHDRLATHGANVAESEHGCTV